MTTKSRRRLEYVPLDDVKPAKRNPKRHDVETLDASLDRFGFTEPVLLDERTGRLVAGHGRLDRLREARARGDAAPEGVQVLRDGTWKLPVVRGWSSRNDAEAEAYLIASNRIVETGGWDLPELTDLLALVQSTDLGLDGIGYLDDDLDTLLDSLRDPDDLDPDNGEYTRKINAPQYEPTTETPPPTSDLYDTSKRDELIELVDAADLPEEVADFLRAAAHRHTRFRYDQIAEFYAHADPEVQEIMETSALVIVDLDDAIRLGYVRLSERMDALLADALAADDEDEA